ncbi:MAG: hypothetical protein V7K17_14515, partial [Nostoc sp.]
PLILVNESFSCVHPPLILVDPPLILVNESFSSVDPPLILVNESLKASLEAAFRDSLVPSL